MTEHEKDKRDLLILDDHEKGMRQIDLMKKYQVSRGHVQRLIRAWKGAA